MLKPMQPKSRTLIKLILIVTLVSLVYGVFMESAATPTESSDTPKAQESSTPASGSGVTLRFSGYDWTVRSWTGLPGPCRFSASNVWVDSNGYVHLKLRKASGVWSCAELYTVKSLTFGTYQWKIQSNLNALDRNVVFGMFPHQQYRLHRYTNEIDIEYAQWGIKDLPYKLKYHVWPPAETTAKQYSEHEAPLSTGGSTVTLVWSKTSVSFEAKYTSTGTVYASWTYAPTDYRNHIPTVPMVNMMNLWLFGNRAPSDGKEVEIVIAEFTYAPET